MRLRVRRSAWISMCMYVKKVNRNFAMKEEENTFVCMYAYVQKVNGRDDLKGVHGCVWQGGKQKRCDERGGKDCEYTQKVSV